MPIWRRDKMADIKLTLESMDFTHSLALMENAILEMKSEVEKLAKATDKAAAVVKDLNKATDKARTEGNSRAKRTYW